MTRQVAPRAPLPDDVARRRVRAQRVERLGIPWCRTCGGATDEPEDRSLWCDCHERHAELIARAHRLLDEHRDPDQMRLADVVAP